MDHNNLMLLPEMLIASGVPMKALKSNSTDIVPFGVVKIFLNISYTVLVRNLVHFPVSIVSQIIGHLLGDGSLELTQTSITPRFVFSQAFSRFDYVWFVFGTLKHYCNRMPTLTMSIRAGTQCWGMYIGPRSYRLLKTLHQLFYVNVNNVYVKVIMPELIMYLNPILVAYWAIDDGSASSSWSGYIQKDSLLMMSID